jgi:hypothetical protein
MVTKNVVFSYYNFQINPDIANYKEQVMSKLISNTDIKYMPLQYNAKDGDIYPDQVINYGLNELFYSQNYDNVLVLDIDCIPLNVHAMHYVFEKANDGVLIGNAQRSHYIQNNEHVFIGSSCMCVNRTVYEKLGKPSMVPTARGDIGEEFVYLAEEKNIPIEIFYPQSYEASPYGAESWALKGDLPHYGIGTTFESSDGKSKFYHLFESRHNLHVDKFISKCELVLNTL